MIEALLPAAVVVVEAFEDRPGEEVFPGEEELVAKAVEVRRREFVTARRCARTALARLGFPSAPILRDLRGAPRWPDGVVGSITHCPGYRAAAVARAGSLASVGIDAETHAPMPDGVPALITAGDEPAHLAELARRHPLVQWERLLFSAKESVYKAWYPLTGRWLGFEDAELTIDSEAGTFGARLLIDGTRLDGGPALTSLSGRYVVAGGLVATAVTVGTG